MVIVGVDPHKNTHTLVAIDGAGCMLGQRTVEATSAGNLVGLRWARTKFGRELLWAVEDVRSVSSRLEADLLDAGQEVVRVASHLTASTRKTSRQPGKSDPLDALAVARVALREPDLPRAAHTGWSREVKLLIDRRDDLLQYRTAAVQRLLWRIHELEPTHRIKPGGLSFATNQRAAGEMLSKHKGLVAELAREELGDVEDLTPRINELERRVASIVRLRAPSLLDLYGCAELTAGRIIGETADISRFTSEAAFARWVGVAPVPLWSGSTRGRLRPHRGGNRRVNAAVHIIALTQIKRGAPGEAYYRAVRERKGSHGAALMSLKRRVVRSVYSRLRADRDIAAY